MIEKHIVNIGHPRCASSWLWQCAGFSPAQDKENRILMDDLNFDQYIRYYQQYKISANFQPNLWQVDQEIIKFVQKCTTHISFVVRNPYNFIERYTDWVYTDQDFNTLTNYFVTSGYIKYANIVDRWAPGAKKFQVFFFEDLERDPYMFFKNYMSFCQVDIAENRVTDYNKKINANPKQKKINLKFTRDQISFINHEIDQFQTLVYKDLTHWKR